MNRCSRSHRKRENKELRLQTEQASGEADAPASSQPTPLEQPAVAAEQKSKQPGYTITPGVCVYRQDDNAPYEIVGYGLVDESTGPRHSAVATIKMLRLRPLMRVSDGLMSDEHTMDVPYAMTVVLQQRFRSVWEEHGCDERSEENAAIRDAHLQAVKRHASVMKKPRREFFNMMRYGAGTHPTGPLPPELVW